MTEEHDTSETTQPGRGVQLPLPYVPTKPPPDDVPTEKHTPLPPNMTVPDE